MPKIALYHFESCPACQKAKKWIAELREEKPELANVEIEMTDVYKNPDYQAPSSFYYVPTFFVDSRKVLEGEVTKEKVEEILRAGI